jgi:hypothetical protein
MVREFHFCTSLKFLELTGRKASTLDELLDGIRQVDGSVIFNHTHHFLLQHQYWLPELPNEFAHWVSEVLLQKELGEKLSSINTVEFGSIRQLREALIQTIQEYTKERSYLPRAPEGMEFNFIRAHSFVIQTPYVARDLEGFYEALSKVSLSSIYYHIFEAKLRLEKGTNDFSFWLGCELGENTMARQIEALDPYTYTLSDLRDRILKMIRLRLNR